MIKNMQNKAGFFYFRNYGYKKDKTSFMRWSNAWMFTALAVIHQIKMKKKYALLQMMLKIILSGSMI
ncbi:MAG: hypothetical protein IPH11_00865 [Ignavibacteriales bacterium]|nr:hypothetical protein [Ignavibacteriales bacterium]